MKTIPFDLEKFKQGAIALSRNKERRYKFIAVVDEAEDDYKLLSLNVQTKKVAVFCLNGACLSGAKYNNIDSNYDLTHLEVPPTTRLIRVEELPPVCHVKFPRAMNAYLVTIRATGLSTDTASIKFNDSFYSIVNLQEHNALWSADLKTWNPFTVEE